MGHLSIVDKSSAYGAKGPGFKTQWMQRFDNIECMFCSFEKIKLRLGPTFKKKNSGIPVTGFQMVVYGQNLLGA